MLIIDKRGMDQDDGLQAKRQALEKNIRQNVLELTTDEKHDDELQCDSSTVPAAASNDRAPQAIAGAENAVAPAEAPASQDNANGTESIKDDCDNAAHQILLPRPQELLDAWREYAEALGFDEIIKIDLQVLDLGPAGGPIDMNGKPLLIVARRAAMIVEFAITEKKPDEKKIISVKKRMQQNGMLGKIRETSNRPSVVFMPDRAYKSVQKRTK